MRLGHWEQGEAVVFYEGQSTTSVGPEASEKPGDLQLSGATTQKTLTLIPGSPSYESPDFGVDDFVRLKSLMSMKSCQFYN